MDLRKASRKMFSSGLVFALVLIAGLREASAQTTTPAKKTTTAAPPKPAQSQTKTAVGNAGHGPTGSTGTGGNAGRGAGSTSAAGSGAFAHTKQPGEEAKSLPGGRTELRDPKSGRTVTTNARGEVQKIEAPLGLAGGRMTINRGPHGGREIVTTRPGGVRVVGYGAHRGFVERSLPGRSGYVSRTYIVGGRSYARVYREYHYRGFVYDHYVPAVYYGPAFYGWVSRPWAPVPYFWGSGITAPWFGFYAGYFTPYSVYASPDLWLTDYLLAENLRLAYENQQAANAGSGPPAQPDVQGGTAPLSPEMKAAIADEVRQQLAAERTAAAQPTSPGPNDPALGPEPLPPALNQKFFVVSSNLDVNALGQARALTPGDIIRRTGGLSAEGSVAVVVESSKPGDCPTDSSTTIELAALQEMHNQLREQIDSGLKMLAENQAKGLPSGPSATPRQVIEGTADQATDAAAQLEAQQSAAANLEAQVRQGGSAN